MNFQPVFHLQIFFFLCAESSNNNNTFDTFHVYNIQCIAAWTLPKVIHPDSHFAQYRSFFFS